MVGREGTDSGTFSQSSKGVEKSLHSVHAMQCACPVGFSFYWSLAWGMCSRFQEPSCAGRLTVRFLPS